MNAQTYIKNGIHDANAAFQIKNCGLCMQMNGQLQSKILESVYRVA